MGRARVAGLSRASVHPAARRRNSKDGQKPLDFGQMRARRLLFAAYICSGAAGLVYEVSWARLLTLSMGHTTAAASTVVAAFMGGLALGAALGGRLATRLTPRAALHWYAGLELAVACIALGIGAELALLTPLLRLAYADGQAPVLFPVVRLSASLLLLTLPAAALGATYPMALRWSAHASTGEGHEAGTLYAANTVGASIGALGAGFLLLPMLGLFHTTLTGVAASVLAATLALVVARTGAKAVEVPVRDAASGSRMTETVRPSRRRATTVAAKGSPVFGLPEAWHSPNLVAAVLALTGFATFTYEIAWTRVFSLVIGPSSYAFSTTLAAVIVGTALGSVIGARLARRLARPALALLFVLGAAAVALAWSTSLAGATVPRSVIRQLADSNQPLASVLLRHGLLIGALMVPVAALLGAAFPLALELVGARGAAIARRIGVVYAFNTVGSVAGSLTSGFLAIPAFGLERTLWIAVAAIGAAAVLVVSGGSFSLRLRIAGLAVPAAALAALWLQGGWNRELLASGAYKYARNVPPGLDPETALTAGSLLYYRDGAVATVSVKRLTGDLSLSVDGMVDASTSGDMLTQRLLAHLPLLLHPDPHDVGIIGLGSGVTLGAALRHPIASAEVVELSREVVDASRFFSAQNHDALLDPRTRLVVGDGRTHLLLGSRQYDVLISEPSNPWMAGAAALFTREFFEAMRAHLAPGGLVCQWAHTYDISDADLRSILGTFQLVFPNATVWMVGEGDLLMVAGDRPLDANIAGLARNWDRPGVRSDLADVGAREPFALQSLFLMGPEQIRAYANGAEVQSDDRLALEFSGPAGMVASDPAGNVSALRAARTSSSMPSPVAEAVADATAAEWSHRGAMMSRASAFDEAFDNYRTALALDPGDTDAPHGLVSAAIAAHRESEAVPLLGALALANSGHVHLRIALSRLLAARGDIEQAIVEATEACRVAPSNLAAWEQLASIFSDVGDAGRLDAAADKLRRLDPGSAAALYYTAASHFLHGRLEPAISTAQRAIAADPRRAPAHHLLGAAYASLGDVNGAREAFTSAIDLDPLDGGTYTTLALLELNARNPAAAGRWFAEALSLDPGSIAAYEGLAQVRALAP
ncbi:MAG: hypothetical protein GEU82_04115 [Luteitalea sp.]|nr:hypothetical protein [Luteitalea sp.]